MRLYQVSPGDSLYVISGKLLSSTRFRGIGALAQAIVAINNQQIGLRPPIDDWTSLRPGILLAVPE